MLVVWNAIAYPDPSDDPSVEIMETVYSSENVYNVVRGCEGTNPAVHCEGTKVALCLTAGMLMDDLRLYELYDELVGSLGYIADPNNNGALRFLPVEPDNEVSEEGHHKILITGGVGASPRWAFVWDEAVGGEKA